MSVAIRQVKVWLPLTSAAEAATCMLCFFKKQLMAAG